MQHAQATQHRTRRRRWGPPLAVVALVAVLSMALAGPALAAGPPSVTKVEPGKGPAAGGTTVTITGTNFVGVQSVKFGGEKKAASFTVNSETSITAVSPELTSLTSAKVAVTVTTLEGTSPETAAGKFVYEPAVSEVRPASGLSAGGTKVTVTGRGFRATALPGEAEHGLWVQGVFFGATQTLGEVSPFGEEIAVTAPAGTGTVDVTVHTQGGISPITPADQFSYTPGAPIAITEPASGITQTSATLNASVNPDGGLVTLCTFEYGLTASYGQSAPCTPPPGGGTTAVPVSAALEGLAEGPTYHFRISATNAGGTSPGGDLTFKTTLVLGPHWYSNNVRLGETALESGQPVMAWGNLTLENTKVGTFTCQTLAGGVLANPIGGGAGKGAFQAITFYDCTEPTCEGLKGLGELIPEKLTWSSVLIEEAGGVFRDRTEGIGLRAICVGGTSDVRYHAMLKPSLEPGTSIGASPAKLEFGAAAGTLASEGEQGTGTVVGRLKLMGFEGGEMIRAKNP